MVYADKNLFEKLQNICSSEIKTFDFWQHFYKERECAYNLSSRRFGNVGNARIIACSAKTLEESVDKQKSRFFTIFLFFEKYRQNFVEWAPREFMRQKLAILSRDEFLQKSRILEL